MVSVRRNFGVCALFLGIHPELKWFLCPKLGEEQKKKKKKKRPSQKMERFLRPKLREDQKKGRFLWPKSLLSVLMLFYYQQQYLCTTLYLCAANLCVCTVSEFCVRAYTLTA